MSFFKNKIATLYDNATVNASYENFQLQKNIKNQLKEKSKYLNIFLKKTHL